MLMRRLESDPEENQQVTDALARAATPTHEQPTEEFDSRKLLIGLGRTADHLFPINRGLKLRDPPELGWERPDGQD